MKNGKKDFIKDLFVFWLAMAAMICASINLNISLNMLGASDEKRDRAGVRKAISGRLKKILKL